MASGGTQSCMLASRCNQGPKFLSFPLPSSVRGFYAHGSKWPIPSVLIYKCARQAEWRRKEAPSWINIFLKHSSWMSYTTHFQVSHRTQALLVTQPNEISEEAGKSSLLAECTITWVKPKGIILRMKGSTAIEWCHFT